MNKLTTLAIALCAITIPSLSFAQTHAPLTRAQVVAELTQLEQAGYDPSAGENTDYPAKLQAAEAKVAAEQTAQAQQPQQPQQAQRAAMPKTQTSASMTNADCTGPASFCNTYFGS
ncbi:DUF4148 domain-containing protein [Burkholderia sp. Ac-20379]|uniref:DUF4148 domain-containing protein n=1 Tax=Burkholderia sp. Ac-20379 TaxID=2703900 RepID=UPI00197FD6D2|nr:DUF4148 domain-containing protein [Burkholderia sp. Ac-20379]MBN3725019.1 DUF4148 domain-containing protein [Burkholderia sp. Ac-20379]